MVIFSSPVRENRVVVLLWERTLTKIMGNGILEICGLDLDRTGPD